MKLRPLGLSPSFRILAFLTLAFGMLAVACSPAESPDAGLSSSAGTSITTAALVAADERRGDWIHYGRTYDEQRFSPLDQVNSENVGELGLAWVFETGTRRGLEATPIVVDGRLYATGTWSVVYALDARSGEELWRWDPEVDRSWGQKACCDVVNRGVAVYDGKVYVGVLDGRLAALDAATGEVIWETVTVDQSKPFTITGAPRIIKGRVLIGNGGAEYGVRGYVSAYDAASGDLDWRFHTVPGNPADGFENDTMKMAAETWTGEWWNVGGGGTVWDAMAYDAELDLLYIGVGNGSPWDQRLRSPEGGDNLFLSSIVALRPETGEYVWHYQTTPGDTWDYTATQHIMLADLEIEGEARKVLMQAPKNGFFYVIDRTNGEFISAEKYVQVTWASHVDPATGRPVEVPGARYEEGVAVVFPSPFGGHNWHPMAFSQDTGLVYIPAQEMSAFYLRDEEFEYTPGQWNLGTTPPREDQIPDEVLAALPIPGDVLTQDVPKELVSGALLAWDPIAQEARWRVDYDLPWTGGLLATAGNLVFQGTPYGLLTAYDASQGGKLWESYAGSGIVAAPMTYELDGEQYVAVLSGWGGAFGLVAASASRAASTDSPGRILAYKIGGNQEPPEEIDRPLEPPTEIAHESTPHQVAAGRVLFGRYCLVCHGYGAVGGGVLNDIRYSNERVFDNYEAILLEGRREDRGMPSFEALLSADDVQSLRAYVLSRRDAAIASSN